MPYDNNTLARWDREHLWHPFTQMQAFVTEELLIISRGEGAYLFDQHGRRYLDGVSSLWCNVHGHRREELDRALVAQLQNVAHSTLLGLAHPPAIVLARRLAEISPAGLNKVFYSDDGSTAMEMTGSGKVGGSSRTSKLSSQRVSPVVMFFRPTSAAMSPESPPSAYPGK